MPIVNVKYCLHCGEAVPVYKEWNKDVHYTREGDFVASCLGPFAETNPPALEENWQDHLLTPSSDEFVIFCEAATQLQNDFFSDDFIQRYELQHYSP